MSDFSKSAPKKATSGRVRKPVVKFEVSEAAAEQALNQKGRKLATAEKDRVAGHFLSYNDPNPSSKYGSVFVPSSVALSDRDRAQQLILSEDQMRVTGVYGGYRLVRATHGVHSGAYYWEAEILEPAPGVSDAINCHVRLGWSTRQGELQGPVGNNSCTYGYRDVSGSKIHNGKRDDNYGESYSVGDIIGCFLNLDTDNIDNNQIRFFKNGKDQGIAYKGGKDIPLGVYFPAISLYMQSSVRVNFGPSFILRHDIFGANAVSEVQPMNPDERKNHDNRISEIRKSNKICREI
jgi:hypothetical protein